MTLFLNLFAFFTGKLELIQIIQDYFCSDSNTLPKFTPIKTCNFPCFDQCVHSELILAKASFAEEPVSWKLFHFEKHPVYY